ADVHPGGRAPPLVAPTSARGSAAARPPLFNPSALPNLMNVACSCRLAVWSRSEGATSMRAGWIRFASLMAVVVGGLALSSPALAHNGRPYRPAPQWENLDRGGGTPRKSAPEIDLAGAGAAAGLLIGGALLLQARRSSQLRANGTP